MRNPSEMLVELGKQENDDTVIYTMNEWRQIAKATDQLETKLKRLDVEMLTTDEAGNPVGCGMDLLDWQAQLQTDLGVCRLKNRDLKAKTDTLRTVGSLLHSLLKQAYLFKGYGTGPLQQPAVCAILKQWEALNEQNNYPTTMARDYNRC